jgi:hypothetical protein
MAARLRDGWRHRRGPCKVLARVQGRQCEAGLRGPLALGRGGRAARARGPDGVGLAQPLHHDGPCHQLVRAQGLEAHPCLHGVPRLRGRHASWFKTPPALSDDSAPFASLDHLETQAALTHPRVPPKHLGSSPWPQELASGRPKDFCFQPPGTLPDEFWDPDKMDGVCGGVEFGFTSTTTERAKAVHYAQGGASTVYAHPRLEPQTSRLPVDVRLLLTSSGPLSKGSR